MKTNQINPSTLNSNKPSMITRESDLQRFLDACANFDGGLVHMLRFLGHPVNRHDFCAEPSCSLTDKIVLLRKELESLKVTAILHSAHKELVVICLAVEKLRQLFVEQIVWYHSDAFLSETDVVVYLMQRIVWQLDAICCARYEGYIRLMEKSDGVVKEYDYGISLVDAVKRKLHCLTDG